VLEWADLVLFILPDRIDVRDKEMNSIKIVNMPILTAEIWSDMYILLATTVG
jgi:hypothetical protein